MVLFIWTLPSLALSPSDKNGEFIPLAFLFQKSLDNFYERVKSAIDLC